MQEAMQFIIDSFTHPRGPGGALEDTEKALGATIIPLGSKTPFHFDEKVWRRGVISVLNGEVRIVAIEAKKKGHGALHQLIMKIEAAGLRPAIIAPMFDMPKILEHWGWDCHIAQDHEGGAYEIWRPPSSCPPHSKLK